MYKLDTHVHTAESSPCGEISAKRIVHKYKKAGYDGIVITDHFIDGLINAPGAVTTEEKINRFLKGYHIAREEGDKVGIDVFLGMELRLNATTPNDYLLYGFNVDFLLKNPDLYLLTVEELIALADVNNFALFQAHPFRANIVPQEAMPGVEVFNGHFNHDSQNDKALEFAKKHGMKKLSGSDCHEPPAVGNAGIILKNRPENIADVFNSQDFELITTPIQQLTLKLSPKDDYFNVTAYYENEICKFSTADKDKAFKTGRYTIIIGDRRISDNFAQLLCGADNNEGIAVFVPSANEELISCCKEKEVTFIFGVGDEITSCRRGHLTVTSLNLTKHIITLRGAKAIIN